MAGYTIHLGSQPYHLVAHQAPWQATIHLRSQPYHLVNHKAPWQATIHLRSQPYHLMAHQAPWQATIHQRITIILPDGPPSPVASYISPKDHNHIA